ncbi:hypothetical protein [Streptomyces sp. NPDC050263]|uniref:AraC-like ligand-binding domain-containing protein n=1 Tax=Streptomyces sp. NPDC050263 TaxID=3155037 RepID=UPI00343B01EE
MRQYRHGVAASGTGAKGFVSVPGGYAGGRRPEQGAAGLPALSGGPRTVGGTSSPWSSSTRRGSRESSGREESPVRHGPSRRTHRAGRPGPAADRFAWWREMTSQTLTRTEITSDHADGLRACFRLVDLGAVRVPVLSYPSSRSRRTSRPRRRSDPEPYHLALTSRGRQSSSRCRRDASVGVGDLWLYDSGVTDWNPEELRTVVDDSLAMLGVVGAPATWLLSNHDVMRHPGRHGRKAARRWAAGERYAPGGPLDLDLGKLSDVVAVAAGQGVGERVPVASGIRSCLSRAFAPRSPSSRLWATRRRSERHLSRSRDSSGTLAPPPAAAPARPRAGAACTRPPASRRPSPTWCAARSPPPAATAGPRSPRRTALAALLDPGRIAQPVVQLRPQHADLSHGPYVALVRHRRVRHPSRADANRSRAVGPGTTQGGDHARPAPAPRAPSADRSRALDPNPALPSRSSGGNGPGPRATPQTDPQVTNQPLTDLVAAKPAEDRAPGRRSPPAAGSQHRAKLDGADLGGGAAAAVATAPGGTAGPSGRPRSFTHRHETFSTPSTLRARSARSPRAPPGFRGGRRPARGFGSRP